jgi:hypothetical protein
MNNPEESFSNEKKSKTRKLEKKIFDTLEELEKYFSNKRKEKIILLEKIEKNYPCFDYDIYGVEIKGYTYPLGYNCKKCKKFIIGIPEYSKINDLELLSGIKGYKLKCKNCNSLLHKKTKNQF